MDPIEKEGNRLTADQRTAWIALRRASILLRAGLERNQRDLHGLDLDDYDILMLIWEARPDGLRMGRLAEILAYSRSRICHRMQRLERAGWVVRRRSSADGRGQEAQLSEEGTVRLQAAVHTMRCDLESSLFDILTQRETRELARIMSKIRRALEERSATPDA